MASAIANQKIKVFISYSRRDITFAERLVAALEARGIEALIDKRDLPLAEEWQRELLGFIRQADSVVYVVSPASVGSHWCVWEVEQVQILGKRLAPVVAAEVDDTKVPEGIRKINYVFFTGEHATSDGFERQSDALAAALKTDLGWIKDHTRLGELARRWVEKGRNNVLLLRGTELEYAERWRARQPPEAPGLTPTYREFISASRLGATRRLRMWLGGALIGALSAASLAGVAWWQRQQAVAENNRFETYFDLVSKENTFRVDEVSDVEDPVALAQRALRSGRNISRRDVKGVKILWVDDNPENNVFDKEKFRQTMSRLGIAFVDATSVKEAEAKISSEKSIDVVISDYKHIGDKPSETPAGFRILELLKKKNPQAPVPLIIYSAGFFAAQADAAKCRGVMAQTRTRATLFAWVLIALDEGRAYKPSREIQTFCTSWRPPDIQTEGTRSVLP